MAIITVPVLVAIGSVLAAAFEWFMTFVAMNYKKLAFYFVAVGLFFATISLVQSAFSIAFDDISGSTYYTNVSGYFSLLGAVFPTNFINIATIMIALEFNLLIARWAMKVIDLKVDFFS